ncbi:MAG: BLUF domain-containing protein [Myxococcota bacterium]
MQLVRTVYASASASPMTEHELGTILAKARETNRRLDVTGLLLYHEGNFLQILEGPAAAVDDLYARIARDRRHSRVLMLQRCDIEARSFGDWRMGFVALDAAMLSKLPGFVTYGSVPRLFEELANHAGRVEALVSAFRDGNFRRAVS